jgi:RNA polymerase sigma factor (sigma-70 family)
LRQRIPRLHNRARQEQLPREGIDYLLDDSVIRRVDEQARRAMNRRAAPSPPFSPGSGDRHPGLKQADRTQLVTLANDDRDGTVWNVRHSRPGTRAMGASSERDRMVDAAEMQPLLERCQRLDRAAFAELFNRYHVQVFRSAYLITRRQDAADDITQLVFIELFSAFRRFDLRRPFLPWLYRIVHNVSIDYLKRDRRGRTFPPPPETQLDALIGPDPAPGPAEQVEQAELRRAIWKAMDRLPVHQRSVLVLSYYGDLSEQELADVLGVRPGTVKSRLHRARQALRAQLAQDGAAFPPHARSRTEPLPLAGSSQEGGE